jgi:hypothetical protein
MRGLPFALLLAPFLGGACLGTTGFHRVAFHAAASGPPGVVGGGPLSFTSDRGFAVTLSRATLHVGAAYLNESIPTSGSGDTTCFLPGQYVGEVRAGVDVDLLSPALQPFGQAGEGTTQHAGVAELWLSGGDIDAPDDPAVILAVRGTVVLRGASVPFEANLTIGQNRAPVAAGNVLPGANPICKQRIVTPLLTDVTLAEGGTLVLVVDPRAFFVNVDFAALTPTAADPGTLGFLDTSDDQPSINLYQNLRAAGGAYRFEWRSAEAR